MTTEPDQSTQLSNNTDLIFKSDKPYNLRILDLSKQMIERGEIKTDPVFAEKFMFSLDSKEEFPINLEVLVEWKIYVKKADAKRVLIKYFKLDTDYSFEIPAAVKTAAGISRHGGAGLNKETIMLTIDCFKNMCMMPRNEMGRKIQRYYLDLEKVLKRYITLERDYFKSENKTIGTNYKSLETRHQNLLKRRKRVNYDRGSVIYFLSHVAFTNHFNTHYTKYGKAVQKNKEGVSVFIKRLSVYNTGAPVNYLVHYLLYCDEVEFVEKCIEKKFKNYINPSNKEWIKGIDLGVLIKFVKDTCDLFDFHYKEVYLNVSQEYIDHIEERKEEEKVVEEEEEVVDEEEEVVEEEEEEEEKVIEEEGDEEEGEEDEEEEILINGFTLEDHTFIEIRKLCKTKFGCIQAGNKPEMIQRIRDTVKRRKEKIKRDMEEKEEKTVVYQYNNRGVLVDSFYSFDEAYVKTRVDVESIKKCMGGFLKKAGGFIWKENSTEFSKEELKRINARSTVGVIKYNPLGVEIRRYNSIKEASKDIGLSRNILDRLCRTGKVRDGYKYSKDTEHSLVRLLSDDDRNEIIKMAKKGVTAGDIANKFHRHPKYMRNLIKKLLG